MNNNLKCIDMKTNYFSSAKSTSIYFIIFGFSMLMVSCGSLKSSTYYDRDGIYGSDENENRAAENNVDKYKDYFSALREKNEQDQVFTDVENYSSIQDSVVNQSETERTSYSGWGNNQQPINITIYDNNWGWNNWGYNSLWNYGWNCNLGWNSWYGPNIGYGWGWNNWYGPNIGWGWGWNNWWGPNYGYYGWGGYNYNNPYYYSYSNGIRGGRSSGRVSGRYDFGRSGISSTRDNSSIGRRNNITNGVRNSDQSSPRSFNSVRSNDSNPRSINSNPRNYSSTRSEITNPRADNESPRNLTPIRVEPSSPRGESSSPRSYSPSPSYGGGGGSFGGGRSGGSGGGGRR
jgi:hypothetical protein